MAVSSTAQLVIWRCPNHPSSWAISLEHAESAGTRLTPFKCCNHWRFVKAMSMSPRQLREVIETCENGIELLTREAEDA